MAVADAPCQYKLGSSLDHRRVAAFRGGRDFVLVRPRFPMVQGAARDHIRPRRIFASSTTCRVEEEELIVHVD